jgi:hypothetical protein
MKNLASEITVPPKATPEGNASVLYTSEYARIIQSAVVQGYWHWI